MRIRSTARLPFSSLLPSIHYGWFILFSAFCSIGACLGFGRFALGMLLPSMAEALALNNAQSGFIGTINFLGYLCGVLIVGKVAHRCPPRISIPAALTLVGTSMIFLSQGQSLITLSLCYFCTGVGSGFANVLTMALVLAWFVPQQSGKACGLVVGGSGVAIITAGMLIPFVNTHFGVNGWQLNWIFLGILVLVAALINVFFIRTNPAAVGILPYQKTSMPSHKGDTHKDPLHTPSSSRKLIYHLGFIYFCFGFTYVIYATFFVSTLVQEMAYTERVAGVFWSWIGVLSLSSGPLFGTLSDSLGRKKCFALVFALQTISYLCLGLQIRALLIFSLVLFGLTAWSIPSIMTAAVGDYFGPLQAAQIFGFVTFLFGLGQISGPFLAGIIADHWGTFSYSFLLAGAITTVAFWAVLFLKQPPQNQPI